jgi:hypothetical protein
MPTVTDNGHPVRNGIGALVTVTGLVVVGALIAGWATRVQSDSGAADEGLTDEPLSGRVEGGI